MRGKTIDELQLAEFQRLNRAGLSARQIADQVGVNPRTITRWRHRLGIGHPECAAPPVALELLSSIAEMIADGASRREICNTLHVHHQTVERHFPGTAWTREQAREFGSTVLILNRKIERNRS